MLTAVVGTALFVTRGRADRVRPRRDHPAHAGAITTVIGLMFVLSIIIQILPDNWRWDIMRFFPDAAGRVISVTIAAAATRTCGRPGRSSW